MADPQSVLDPLTVPREQKAAAWDAFQSAADQQDFQKRLDALQLPREAKAQLWDMKYGGGQQVQQQAPQQSDIWSRALSNLPSSLKNFVQNAPFVPSAGPLPVKDASGNWSFPPIDPLGEIGGFIGNMADLVLNPSEHFAQDPVGTVAFPAMAAYGAFGGPGMHPAIEQGRGAIKAGVKEAAAQVKKELPAIGKWEATATPAGAVLGYIAGEPRIGTAVGATAGAMRAIPPALRGFRKGFSGYEPPLTVPDFPPPSGAPSARFDPGQYGIRIVNAPVEVGGAHVPDYRGPIIPPEMPPEPPTSGPTYTQKPSGRFVPGQYDAPRPTQPPVEVGGAHIPDYKGPVIGPPPEPTPAAPSGPAPVTPEVESIYKATAKNMGAKSFEDLPQAVQDVVKAEVAKRTGAQIPTAQTPTPESGIIPEGEHAIIRRVAEANRANKDITIARSLKDENITREMLDKMSDADLKARVKALGYTPSYGKNYSRTWEAFRRDLRQLVDPAPKLTTPPMPPE